MIFRKTSSLRAALAATVLVAGAALAGHASATAVTWDLENVTFNDDSVATGWFTYDADTSTYSAWDITTTATVNGYKNGYQYLSAVEYTSSTGYVSTVVPNSRGTEFLIGSGSTRDSFGPIFETAMTDAGGTILLGSSSGRGSEVQGIFNSRLIESGEIVSVSAAPEPATWALMIVGLGGVGAALRLGRRKIAGALAAI